MNTVLPTMIIIVLGSFLGLAQHRLRWLLLFRSGAAALLATLVWVCGTYLLMWINAPDELGPPLAEPILVTFFVALVPALIVDRLIRQKAY